MSGVDQTGLAAAFAAGLASFLSPCVLPLLPGYLSYLSGVSIEQMEQRGRGGTSRVLAASLLFVAGFSAVFVAMGAAASGLGSFLREHSVLLTRIAGAVIIFFGLQLMGVGRLRFMMAEKRYQGRIKTGPVGSVLLGMAFAFGWSPCVGPILFSILAYAATRETMWQGVALLAAYSAGLAIPLLLVGLGTGTFIRLLDRYSRHLRWAQAAAGLLLIVFGLLVLLGRGQWLAGFIPQDWSVSG